MAGVSGWGIGVGCNLVEQLDGTAGVGEAAGDFFAPVVELGEGVAEASVDLLLGALQVLGNVGEQPRLPRLIEPQGALAVLLVDEQDERQHEAVRHDEHAVLGVGAREDRTGDGIRAV